MNAAPQRTRPDAAHFDAKAREWEQNPVFRERGEKLAAAIRARVPLHTGMRVLDYGCGTGALSFPFANEVGAALLADHSAGMLAVCAEKIAGQGLSHYTTSQLDLMSGPMPADLVTEARFDLVVTAMTLHHVPDTDRILRIFYDLLAPGGHLCVADLDREDGSFHGPEVDVHWGFERAALGAKIAAAGFVEHQFDTVYAISKDSDTGPRDYPVFLMHARRAD